MRRIVISIHMLLGFISINVMAEAGKTDFSSIEALERSQIISELSWRLDTKQTCNQTLTWDDSGSGADLDGYFFTPVESKSEYIIGGHASGKRTSDYHCVLTVSEPGTNPKETPPLLVAPIDWKQIWKDSGSGATRDGSMWQAIPPDDNYRCIGSMTQLGHNKKPNLPNYRCVHASLTEKIVAKSIVWSDKGTGADQPVTVFGLPTTGAYTAVAKRTNQTEAFELRKNATSVPDAKVVDQILAQRMEKIKAGLEAEIIANREKQKQQEPKQQAKPEEPVKQVETKPATEIVEQKTTVAKTETITPVKEAAKKTSEEIDKKAAEQKRQAELAAQKAAAEKAEKKKLAEQAEQEKIAQQAAEKKAAEKAVQEKIVEETEEPEPIAQTTTDTQPETTTEKPGSKSLDDLLYELAKNAAIGLGGLILLYIVIFKVLFKSRKTPTGK